jgi:E3 ubiquitin-protein ligase BRE1
MTSALVQLLAPPPSFDKIKMEDRKRSLVVDADDVAPSRKRLVKDEHGQQMRMNDDKEKDVEVCSSPPCAYAILSN